MKRIVLVLLALTISIPSFSQNIKVTPDMGRRLSVWAESSDVRRALAFQILRDLYPLESNAYLSKIADNFDSNLNDARLVLIGIYDINGPDLGYAAIKDYFTKEQLQTIDQLYVESGGKITDKSTESESSIYSIIAKQMGLTKDIARRFKNFCYEYPRIHSMVINVLSKRGITDFESFRVIDAFEDNLGYVAECIARVIDYDGGTDEAYFTLKLFLTMPQIDLVCEMYDYIKEEEEKIREERIEVFKEEVHSLMPYSFPKDDLNNYGRKAFSAVDRILRQCDSKNYSIVVKDSLFANYDKTYNHFVKLDITGDIISKEKELIEAINGIKISPMVIENKELRCSCLASAYGCYSFEYEVTQMESSYQVKYPKSNYDSSSKDQAPLLLGDSNKYSKEIEKAVAKYLSDNKKFNKRKVKVIETCRNGITEDIEVILLDKKAIIE